MAWKYVTIPMLAKRIGVTPASVRRWIKRGYIERPREVPPTGERAYTEQEAESISEWYLDRAAYGGTRGPGAARRRELAYGVLYSRGETRKQIAERYPVRPFGWSDSRNAGEGRKDD